MKAPQHLQPDTAAWFEAVCRDYVLEPHHIRLLTLAAEAWDRHVEARERLFLHGPTYLDRFEQPHARPEIAIERDSRIAFCRCVRELGLDYEVENRPPSLRDAAPKVRTA
jgi:phage terminase small subunit